LREDDEAEDGCSGAKPKRCGWSKGLVSRAGAHLEEHIGRIVVAPAEGEERRKKLLLF
jgi:hypothetical protein